MHNRSRDEHQPRQRNGKSHAKRTRKSGEVCSNRLPDGVAGMCCTELGYDRDTHVDEPGPQEHLDRQLVRYLDERTRHLPRRNKRRRHPDGKLHPWNQRTCHPDRNPHLQVSRGKAPLKMPSSPANLEISLTLSTSTTSSGKTHDMISGPIRYNRNRELNTRGCASRSPLFF